MFFVFLVPSDVAKTEILERTGWGMKVLKENIIYNV